MVKIAPSITTVDFAHLQAEVDKVKTGDILHLDIMDGNFVPNITFGPALVKSINTPLTKESHLMIKSPSKFIERFVDAGSKRISFHVEIEENLLKNIKLVKSLNKKVGLAINPATPLSKLKPYLNKIDFVLVMSVNPGFGAQSFMPSVLGKIKELRKIYSGDIEVDGGINLETGKQCVEAGANILVVGAFLYASKNPEELIRKLKDLG